MDIALILADEGVTGRADPAYDAHMLPIGKWSLAVWEGWLILILDSLTSVVKQAVSRLAAAKNRWGVAYGPAAAFVLSCWRLGWQVISAVMVITDEGRELNFILDPRQWCSISAGWLSRGGCGEGSKRPPPGWLPMGPAGEHLWNPYGSY